MSSLRVLGGDPAVPDHGLVATVTSDVDTRLNDGAEGAAFERSGAAGFLAAPLLRIVGERGRRRLVVGQIRVAVPDDGEATVTLAVQACWAESGGWHHVPDLPDHTDAELLAALAEPVHLIEGDARAIAVTAGKAFAEGSRNEVLRFRSLRYDLERQLADLLARRQHTDLRRLLAEIIELAMALSRARDQAREAVRDGLWIWLWDDETYHRNRPDTIATTERPTTPAWAGTHRAAVRQCMAMETQLAEEIARLHELLSSMSTFAVAQDGEAQQRFNLIAAVAAAGLGLPALILGLYGAQEHLPLDTADRAWRALLPIAATTLVTTVAALKWLPGGARRRHYLLGIAAVTALLLMLLVAGAIAPG